MALKSTENLGKYSQNIEILADKENNLKALIDELQAKVVALAALANETKSVVNAGTGTIESDDVTI